MTYKLYLDDIRACPEGWAIARSYKAFTELVERQGLPEAISFDHDLGLEESGYDALKWLIEREYDLRDVVITVHSANPVGAENIRKLAANYVRFLQADRRNKT